ncbi:hypothetical protein BpHYR1_037645, partial [Brachionus plicatilis]
GKISMETEYTDTSKPNNSNVPPLSYHKMFTTKNKPKSKQCRVENALTQVRLKINLRFNKQIDVPNANHWEHACFHNEPHAIRTSRTSGNSLVSMRIFFQYLIEPFGATFCLSHWYCDRLDEYPKEWNFERKKDLQLLRDDQLRFCHSLTVACPKSLLNKRILRGYISRLQPRIHASCNKTKNVYRQHS